MHTSTGKQTERIYEKIIISGFEVEQYQYKDKPVMRNYKRKKREKRKDENNDDKKPKAKAKSSISHTRKDIRRIINSNPQLNKFLTLTTVETDLTKMNNLFNLFTQRMKDRFSEFQYFSIIEFQKDIDFFGKVKPDGGAVHYHLLCNLRYVKSDEIEKIWGHGFIKIKRVNHVTNLGAYMSKYLQKDMYDTRLFGKKKFFCSQDLKRPTEIINEEARTYKKDNLDNLEKKWESTFYVDYRGEIIYRSFHMKKRPLAFIKKS